MYYSYVAIEYIAPSFSPARTDLALKLLRLLPYANGQHINVTKYCMHVLYECGKQFEVAVSLNHDIMTSF